MPTALQRRDGLALAVLIGGVAYCLVAPIPLFRLLGLVLALLVLLLPLSRRVMKLLLVLIVLTGLSLPWLLRYRPAVVAAPGHEMRWPTRPAPLAGMAKSIRSLEEKRLCTYRLLGWDAGNTLYYRETCRGDARLWAYHPEQETLRRVSALPTAISRESVPRRDLLDRVVVPSVYPPSAEADMRRLCVRESGLVSPDGRWIALVARRVYGPEDVIILGATTKGSGE